MGLCLSKGPGSGATAGVSPCWIWDRYPVVKNKGASKQQLGIKTGVEKSDSKAIAISRRASTFNLESNILTYNDFLLKPLDTKRFQYTFQRKRQYTSSLGLALF